MSALADECIRRFASLRRLKANTYPRDGSRDDIIKSDLWVAYLMFLENDGKNICQLMDYAQIHRFALDFARLNGRLHEGAGMRGYWPMDSELNALGLWIFWFTDSVRVGNETNDERLDIVDSLSSILRHKVPKRAFANHGPPGSALNKTSRTKQQQPRFYPKSISGTPTLLNPKLFWRKPVLGPPTYFIGGHLGFPDTTGTETKDSRPG